MAYGEASFQKDNLLRPQTFFHTPSLSELSAGCVGNLSPFEQILKYNCNRFHVRRRLSHLSRILS